MSGHELNPDWILSDPTASLETRSPRIDNELITVAHALWPRIQAHARREFVSGSLDDNLALATEVWESVLQSVSKTLHRTNGKSSRIVDLEAYLFGAFHHRFNRALRKERRRQETIEVVPSSGDLEVFREARNAKSALNLEQLIQVKEAVKSMDDWTRKVWVARQYGYSWREIAKHFGLTEPQAKLRFRYAIGKLRAHFSRDR
jgi:RNA polymerase sigma factor (sigma-70 family)